MRKYLLSVLQTIINGYISLDPYASSLRQPLLNKVIEINIRELPFPLFFEFTPDKILLKKQVDAPNARISGLLMNMGRLTQRKNKAAAMAELGITLEGDLDDAQAFQVFWASIHIDWEEVMASFLGDPLAVVLGRSARTLKRALSKAAVTLTQNTGEYIQEEIRLLPPREEVSDFMQDVDGLRSDLDRLVLRVERLEKNHE